MGLFSLVSSIIGAGSQKKASRKAQAAQTAALQSGIDEQRRQFDLTRSDYAPLTSMLAPATGALGDLVGINGGEAQGTAIDALKASPFYQSLFRSGEESVLQNASATGGLRGGNTQRGLADFGADTLMKTIVQQLSSLGGLTGLASGAVGNVAGYGANATDAITALLKGQGDAKASGILTRGGINAGIANSVGGFLDDAASAFMPGGGGLKSILSGGF